MTGLRERKKEAARLSLHEAALRLISEHGPDQVTVEAITDAASMSRRSFSNYFANKEEALFYLDTVRARRLIDLVRARPSEERPLAAVRAAFDEFARTSVYDAEQSAHRRLLRSWPSLQAHRAATTVATELDLAAELRRRLPDDQRADLNARVLAAGVLAAYRVASAEWADQQRTPLPELVAAALDNFRE